ncbi:hypothetical protein QO034_22080 [Sedimentitalea sp. JM2-8]|uniref:Uncharacterized protein n=1 Tax=Sedimentitalea xiamensis TaxID=3050037 RepID=A0ABT7FL69_9RHOB|nr:hypothetical protein [Sedimentitalea xiamensis]
MLGIDFMRLTATALLITFTPATALAGCPTADDLKERLIYFFGYADFGAIGL